MYTVMYYWGKLKEEVDKRWEEYLAQEVPEGEPPMQRIQFMNEICEEFWECEDGDVRAKVEDAMLAQDGDEDDGEEDGNTGEITAELLKEFDQ